MRFKDWKIRTKMAAGYVFIVIVATVIVLSSMMNTNNVRNSFLHLQQYPTERYTILNRFDASFIEARRTVTAMSFFAGDEATITELWNNGVEMLVQTNRLMESYRENLRHDTRIDPVLREDLTHSSYYVQQQRQRHFDEVAYAMYRTTMDNAPDVRDRIAAIFEHSGYVNGYVRAGLDYMMSAARNTAHTMQEETLSSSIRVRNMLWVLTAVAGLIVIVVSLVVPSAIAKPIQKVVTALGEVAAGDFNVNLNRSDITKDETGNLTRDVLGLVEVIEGLSNDLTTIYTEHIDKGNYEYALDESKYSGMYKEIASSLNRAVIAYASDLVELVNVAKSYGEGDFDANVSQYPESWKWANDAIDGLRANFINITTEINNMVDAAANKGDLSFKIDETKYEGDWRKIMLGLNQIAAAIDMPLKAIGMVMKEMKVGNFDLMEIEQKLAAEGLEADATNYKGAFKVITVAIQQLALVTASYLNEIEQVLAKMAEGDMRITISREYTGSYDSIKRSVNNISSTLKKTMTEISAASEQVLSGASQISQSAMDLAGGAQEQAGSVQQLNISIDMINEQTRQNAENAAEANVLSGRSAENADVANEAMQLMLAAMNGIKDAGGNISKINRTIQDIAFQTNLLALNASVEAARAGEHGKGFSVVAEEVRTLAGRSQNAAEETTLLIQDSIKRVDDGSKISESTAMALEIIVNNAEEMLQIINDISASSKEQAEAIGQVSNGIRQISSVVQSNSAVSQEAAAAAEELTSQAKLLRQLVAYFKL
ncbi:MAG: methyl-accepting chemotaxis protein [Clostridiales bacterium]|jgi:methyl-accepting chemotaxis protein|nr:methyl-accepting chemotaxis protein [Clostridiales bacterium]